MQRISDTRKISSGVQLDSGCAELTLNDGKTAM